MTQSHKEWLEERKTGIGGSDAAAVCGMSPWATPLDVYMEKVGYLDAVGRSAKEETPDMRRGTLLEPVVLQMYTDETGIVVHKPETALVSTVYPFMRANLDGVAVGHEKKGIEAKTARNRAGWGEPYSVEIPLPYLFQCQHNMVVSGLDVFDVPVLFGDFEFAIYTVPADREFQELMVEQERAFWAKVVARTPPEPVNDADVSKRWRVSKPVSRKATKADLEIGGHLLAVREYFTRLEAYKESLEAELKRSMEDVEALVCGEETICTWKTGKGRTCFDKDRFQKEHPELYAEYVYQSAASRPFLFKEKAKCLQIMKPLLAENLLPNRALLSGS
ncbi:MAG: YqaJ viral recombinase family protein [Planctomycetaceae bacterium]|nr:YqaJ viral recombinase family protein [Planctomycetaceae bacterium]